jgi:putative flavoprotein involved in K+ transport
VPGFAAALSPQVVQLHSSDYRRPSDFPSGHVVVVGAGNSGRQIAEELARTHEVTLAVGRRTLQLPQRVLGKDLFWWLTRLGVITKWVESGLARRMRTRGELIIGTPLSRLERAGVRICRRVVDVTHEQVVFEVGSVDRPSAVVWATGFHSDHSWIDIPDLIADDGSIRHERGITAVPGLAFLGLSALLGFIKTDAAWVARQLEAQRRLGPASSAATTKNRITG